MTITLSELVFLSMGLLIGVILVRYGIGLGAKMTNEGIIKSPPLPDYTGEVEEKEKD